MGDDGKWSKTIPIDSNVDVNSSGYEKVHQVKPVKKKRRDKSDLGDNFVAPDGGWGWTVAIASGVSMLVNLATVQQFGIIFREYMTDLGISSPQLTTIINTHFAVSAITGLLNGPLFRRFSYRQVAMVGSILAFIGLFMCVFANSFIFYVLAFSCCYGFGRGITVSASSLAVNTFFKERRRTAMAYLYSVAGLGPICCPFLAIFLLGQVGVRYTVLCFAGLSLNSIACALVYQPVKWHVKRQANDAEASRKLSTIDDDDYHIIAQLVELETPVLPRSADDWFNSKTSLNNPSRRNRLGSLEKQQQQKLNQCDELGIELERLNGNNTDVNAKVRSLSVSDSFKEKQNDYNNKLDKQQEAQNKLSIMKKIAIFFDLDLLRDFTYLNLAMGLTLINFVEVNFAILTPFILSDFGFDKSQIAMAMSLLGFCDLVVRFLVPLITAKINLSNTAFFSVGILGMCVGRICLSCTTNFYVMLSTFAWMGLSKAFRIVFGSLIIPGYVPLKRLPAAAGLQLLMSGVFALACGPLIGLIRDKTNYAFALNFLNMLCLLALSMWLLESLVRRWRNNSKPVAGGLK